MNTNRYSKRKVTPYEKRMAAKLRKVPMVRRAVILATQCSVAPGYIDETGHPVPLINGGSREAWFEPFLQDADEVRKAWAKDPDAVILLKVTGDGPARRFVYDGIQITPVPIP